MGSTCGLSLCLQEEETMKVRIVWFLHRSIICRCSLNMCDFGLCLNAKETRFTSWTGGVAMESWKSAASQLTWKERETFLSLESQKHIIAWILWPAANKFFYSLCPQTHCGILSFDLQTLWLSSSKSDKIKKYSDSSTKRSGQSFLFM